MVVLLWRQIVLLFDSNVTGATMVYDITIVQYDITIVAPCPKL